MSWLVAADGFVKRIWSDSQGYPHVICLLGPPGAGKTACIQAVCAEVERQGLLHGYFDLRSAPQDTDHLFRWLFIQLRRQGWPVPANPLAPRLDFVSRLVDVEREFTSGAVVVFDHIESLREDAAQALISDLREYQERVHSHNASRIFCIVSGSASMIDLRERPNSPNLEFDCETLPKWEQGLGSLCIDRFCETHPRRVGPDARQKLLAYTGGEPGFLQMIEPFLPNGKVSTRDVTRAAHTVIRRSNEFPQLTHIALVYWVDQEVRRCADRLIDGGQAHLRHGGNTSMDLDPLQLRGALVAEEQPPYRYRFRNELVADLIRWCQAAGAGRSRLLLPDSLAATGGIIAACMHADSVDDWQQGLARVWRYMFGSELHLNVDFTVADTLDERPDPWCVAAPSAACWISLIAGRQSILLETIIGRKWYVRATCRPEPALGKLVKDRHAMESWLGFFARSAERAALLHFAALGTAQFQAERIARESRKQKVFVVFGRDVKKRDAMYNFLKALDLEPIDWIRAKELTNKSTPNVFEVVDAAMRNAQACIVLLTGDDESRLRSHLVQHADDQGEKRLTPQPRANVIFESGMALGRYPERTILVQFGKIRPFSDVGGFIVIRYGVDARFREELVSALKTAKCPVNDVAQDWRTAGLFDS